MATRNLGTSAAQHKLQQIQGEVSARKITLSLKPVVWVRNSLEKLVGFGDEVRRLGGFELTLVQMGEAPTDYDSMPGIGAGAMEIRMATADGWYRIFYVARFSDGIYVLDVIKKKTNKTTQADIGRAADRYKEAVNLSKANAAALAAKKVVAKAPAHGWKGR